MKRILSGALILVAVGAFLVLTLGSSSGGGQHHCGACEDAPHGPFGTSFGLHGKPDSGKNTAPRSIEPGQRST